MLLAADDQVVEDSDVQEAQGLLQARCDFAVGFAGLRVAARVIVKQDDCGGAELESALSNDSRVDIAPVDGPGEQMLSGQDLVLGVEEENTEHLVGQMGASSDQVAAGLLRAVDAALALKALLQDIRCREENPLFVHPELVLGRAILGAALHRFVSTSALCASWEPTGEALGPTAPESEHRASGAQRRAATQRQRREGGLPCGRDSEAKIPFKRPSVGGDSTCMPYKACGLNGIRMDGVD